ncbi:hypothetical protein Strain138_002475 [Pseudogemmatithrix spongiicola]|uniref:Uncharacterized protein n=1 Tax=Pseudogemmatithrix spongiicola TaxID=3062599 RepID=A0AA49JWG5_9BACT|nr:hypothetical protein Strain138_002475 [Gemmatimonadaceae bacterium 'strain 138']WKW16067.1 hypothetical protein Strain318_002475 [Gemmatimonadaceae bacterium 'strain 318']
MHPHGLTRSLLFGAALLMGVGQSVSAVAHGTAHAHEATHESVAVHGHDHDHEAADVSDALAVSPDAHQHEHPHAVVSAGLKSRTDWTPIDLAVAAEVGLLPPRGDVLPPREAFASDPPAARRHSSVSPRAPPAR